MTIQKEKKETHYPNLNSWGIIGFNFVPKLLKDLVATVDWTRERSLPHKTREGTHAHEQSWDVEQRQKQEVPKTTPNNNAGDGALTAGLRKSLGAEQPAAMGHSRVPARRGWRTRWAAFASVAIADGGWLMMVLGFHGWSRTVEAMQERRWRKILEKENRDSEEFVRDISVGEW